MAKVPDMVAVPVTVCPPGDVKVTLRSLPLALASDNGTYKVTCLDCTEVNVIVVGTGRAAVERGDKTCTSSSSQ